MAEQLVSAPKDLSILRDEINKEFQSVSPDTVSKAPGVAVEYAEALIARMNHNADWREKEGDLLAIEARQIRERVGLWQTALDNSKDMKWDEMKNLMIQNSLNEAVGVGVELGRHFSYWTDDAKKDYSRANSLLVLAASLP